MSTHTQLIAVLAVSIAATMSYSRGAPPPKTPLEHRLQLEAVEQQLDHLRGRLSVYKARFKAYPMNLQTLVEMKQIKDIPKNPLIRGDGSVASVQNGTADWYYDPDTGTIEPGSKEVADQIRAHYLPTPRSRIVPEKEIQDCLHSLVSASSEKETQDGLKRLRYLAGDSVGRNIVPQLLYFQQTYRPATRREAIDSHFAVEKLIDRLEIREGQYLQGILPYIGTDDPQLRKRINSILKLVESGNAGTPDFSYYRSVLDSYHRTRGCIPVELVRHMFRRSPGQTLLVCMRLYAEDYMQVWKPVTWAEHVVSEVLWKQEHSFLKRDEIEPAAAEQLDMLSRHDGWWARLYVAEIMRQHPEFRVDETVQRLANDKNELVRQAAAALKEPTKKASKPGAANGEKTAPATDLPAAKRK